MRRKGALPGKIFALCIPERRFAALFGYMAREYCQTQLVLDTRRRYVAREGRFSRPGPLRGCMKREYCHERPPGKVPRRNIAAVGRWGGRNSRASCHRRASGDASRRNIAAASRSRTHFAKILPWTNARIRLAANNDRPPAKQRQRQDPGNAPPPRQKKASVLLAFFRCLVLQLEWPRTFEATSHLPSESPLLGIPCPAELRFTSDLPIASQRTKNLARID